MYKYYAKFDLTNKCIKEGVLNLLGIFLYVVTNVLSGLISRSKRHKKAKLPIMAVSHCNRYCNNYYSDL